MVQGQNAMFRVRDVENQVHALERALKALKSKHVLAWIAEHGKAVPPGYQGLAAVSRLEHFGALRIPATSGVWNRATGWAIHSRILGVAEGDYMKFDASGFILDERTSKAFLELERQSVKSDRFEENAFRVFPIRFSTDPMPELRDGEFFLDLASMMWLLASHPKWKTSEGEHMFRCLGERHVNGSTLLVGYANSSRKLTFRENPSGQYPVVIGKVLS